jgi:hypothetical protein
MLARLSPVAFALPLLALLAAPASRADDAMAEVVSKSDYQIPDGLSDLRRGAVQAALDEVGGTSSRPGKASGGKRYGAEHLQKYVMAAFNWKQGQIPKDWQKKIDAIQTPTKPGERPHEVNNWCGFFVTYALKTGGAPQSIKWMPSIGIRKYFNTKDKRGYRTDFANMKPGDVALFSLKSHHALVAEVDGKNVKTIDGNAAYGEVNIHRRVLGKGAQHIIGFYSLDDLK